MGPNLIALSVPLFFLGIGLELWGARRRGMQVYRLADAVSDIGCGVFQQIAQAFYAAALLALYTGIHARFGQLHFSQGSPWPWVFALVGVEFAYYWWHRLSHEVNFLWAAHVVHHQSEDYNLAVALRQSVVTSFTVFPFYATLAVVGVPPLHFGVAVALSTLYQFWIHTQLVGTVGLLERWLNTPSLHRVHHAINPGYIDKNYGGIVSVFDRLFGTYQPETEPPVYGLVSPLRSFNPLWAQVAYPVELLRRTGRVKRVGDAVRLWLKGPEWSIPGVEEPRLPVPVSPHSYLKFEAHSTPAARLYVLAHFAAILGATFGVMMWGGSLPPWALGVIATLILISLGTFGGLLESRGWAFKLEPLRLAFLVGAAVAIGRGGPVMLIAVPVALAVLSAAVIAVRPELRTAPAR
ncbi:MAG: sterol desaturase family protein [Myxococcota bacterium]|nr:sterol desaturase family protein [Myxococcota bacterium]